MRSISEEGSPTHPKVPVPVGVKSAAKIALELLNNGFIGGTKSGHLRAKQLANEEYIPYEDFIVIRNWFKK